jgi:hypothetical protein
MDVKRPYRDEEGMGVVMIGKYAAGCVDGERN